jgi:hypothetical protein
MIRKEPGHAVEILAQARKGSRAIDKAASQWLAAFTFFR